VGTALVGDVGAAGGDESADDGADRALRTGGAAHDDNAAVDNTATEASPISAAVRARSSTKEPPASSDALGSRKVARVARVALAVGQESVQVMRAELPPGWSRTPVAADSTAAFGNEIGPSAVCIMVNIKLIAVTRPSYWPPSAPARKVM
jgi:hypothetical protein